VRQAPEPRAARADGVDVAEGTDAHIPCKTIFFPFGDQQPRSALPGTWVTCRSAVPFALIVNDAAPVRGWPHSPNQQEVP
jgi:hypothetical protein